MNIGDPNVPIVEILGGDQILLGIEEGWITPPSRTGKLNAPLQLQSLCRSMDVIAEERGE
ncbi:MAG: hypothetical protein ABR67_01370 [Acidimicrobium sp. BACL17 MAG-120823-bin42]|jgi:hypothetical protein|nr:MAG: hypothetical protein ABR57_00100 [Acidimicrobium sp. BACL17 MAG-120924-bin0]KRO43931.1 MAG: hypothetical protein ABR67_01370 [Acidimicrobium sp. BACL17 MAG-120823-bin42]MDA2999847.1 hypothetical protein [Actinomycetota bacterium]